MEIFLNESSECELCEYAKTDFCKIFCLLFSSATYSVLESEGFRMEPYRGARFDTVSSSNPTESPNIPYACMVSRVCRAALRASSGC